MACIDARFLIVGLDEARFNLVLSSPKSKVDPRREFVELALWRSENEAACLGGRYLSKLGPVSFERESLRRGSRAGPSGCVGRCGMEWRWRGWLEEEVVVVVFVVVERGEYDEDGGRV